MHQNPPPLIEIRNATVVRNGITILKGLNLSIEEGEHTTIIGPNGCGKSTLLKLLTSELRAVADPTGSAAVMLRGLALWNVAEVRKVLGIVTGDLSALFSTSDDILGLDVVLSGFFASIGTASHQRIKPDMIEAAEQAMTDVGVAHLCSRPISQTSTGEARRLLIARALVNNPTALVLDEPSSGLDISAAERLFEDVRSLAENGKTIVLVTHHLEEILPQTNKVVLMRSGHIVRSGTPSEMLTSDGISELFGRKISVVSDDGHYSAQIVR